jgi:hypothetical protein
MSTMILFSSLLDVFASVVSDWLILKSLGTFDSALCDKELRLDLMDLFKSKSVKIKDTMDIEYDGDEKLTSESKILVNWITNRQIHFESYKFVDISFRESVQNSSGLYFTERCRSLHFVESYFSIDQDLQSSLGYMNSDDVDKILQHSANNLSTFINSSKDLTTLYMYTSMTCTTNLIKSIQLPILAQLVSLTLHWDGCHFRVHESLFHLSQVCTCLEVLHILRCPHGTSRQDYFLSEDLSALIVKNQRLKSLKCNTLRVTNHLLRLLSNKSLATIFLHGLSEAYINKNSHVEVLTLDVMAQLYVHCANLSATVDIEIADALHMRNWSPDMTPFGEIKNALMLARKCYIPMQNLFSPTNSDLCQFFCKLGVSLDTNKLLQWISLIGFQNLSSDVIDEFSRSFLGLKKLRIIQCGSRFTSCEDDSVLRLCQKGSIDYLDFDGKDSFRGFVPYDLPNCERTVYIRFKDFFVDYNLLHWTNLLL